MLDRKIVFYAVDDLNQADPFDLDTAVAEVNDLDDQVWIVEDHGILMAAIVDDAGHGGRPICLRFLRIRDDRPHIIGPSRETQLVHIEQDHRVTDFTYAIIWPDRFVGAIASRDAPPIKYLSTYFAKTAKQRCVIENLYASDTVKRLKALRKRGLTKALVKIATSEVEQIEDDSTLRGFRGIFEAGKASEAITVAVELSVDRKRERFLHKDVGRGVERLATYGDLVDTLIVVGEDENGRRHELDLKKQRIFTRVRYDQNDSHDMMYARIEAARREVEDPDNGKPLVRAAKMSSLG